MPTKKKTKPKFSLLDKPWIEETVSIYRRAGFMGRFPPGGDVVADVVRAFEETFGRPPKWNTPFENERLLALDLDRAVFRAPNTDAALLVEEYARAMSPALLVHSGGADKDAGITVAFTGGTKRKTLQPRVRKGLVDVDALLADLNALLPKKGRRLARVENDGHDPRTLVVAIDRAGRAELTKNRGLRFHGV